MGSRQRTDGNGFEAPAGHSPIPTVCTGCQGLTNSGADAGFCGNIGFRWQPGTAALPDHVLGHIGYAVVPWKQRRGYASRALGLMLAEARKEGLPYVELTTDPDNEASQKVIANNGGVFIERFRTVAGHGRKEEFRWRIAL